MEVGVRVVEEVTMEKITRTRKKKYKLGKKIGRKLQWMASCLRPMPQCEHGDSGNIRKWWSKMGMKRRVRRMGATIFGSKTLIVGSKATSMA